MELLPLVAGLLRKRGIADGDFARFLRPDIADMSDPMTIRGAAEFTARLSLAIENDENVLIFGDYDADGICASAIFYLYLRERLTNVNVFIPTRAEGYGLSEAAIERAAEEYAPDLIITCDCGISCADEAEYVLDLGMDIMITDHHEPPETLPRCIVVNPKVQAAEGGVIPSHDLCGAGVVFQLVSASGGRAEALKYLDLAAIATIGDMVPLSGENRILAAAGLAAINSKPRPCIRSLLERAEAVFPVSARDIAFKLTPRLNAAGRMGDPRRALDLLIADNPDAVMRLTEELEAANAARRSASDALTREALADLRAERFCTEPAVVLSGAVWELGVAGISAAALCGIFARPVFLMCGSGKGTYKGTARGTEGVNLYSMLTELSDCLLDFGGHEHAAGFSIEESRIPVFKRRVHEYLAARPAPPAPRPKYDAEIAPADITAELARQLEYLEPFGTENPQPRFKLPLKKTESSPFKKKTAHINVRIEGGVPLKGFNCRKLLDLYNSSTAKDVIIEVAMNRYNGAENAEALIRETVCGLVDADADGDKLLCQYIYSGTLTGKKTPVPPEYYDPADLKALCAAAGASPFGTLVLAFSYGGYERFCGAAEPCDFAHDLIYASGAGNRNRVILAPAFDFEPEFYRTVILTDPPIDPCLYGYLADAGCRVYAPRPCGGGSVLNERLREKCALMRGGAGEARANLGRYYNLLRGLAAQTDCDTGYALPDAYALYAAAAARYGDVPRVDFFAAFHILDDLGLIALEENRLKIIPQSAKCDLSAGRLYNILWKILSQN